MAYSMPKLHQIKNIASTQIKSLSSGYGYF